MWTLEPRRHKFNYLTLHKYLATPREIGDPVFLVLYKHSKRVQTNIATEVFQNETFLMSHEQRAKQGIGAGGSGSRGGPRGQFVLTLECPGTWSGTWQLDSSPIPLSLTHADISK